MLDDRKFYNPVTSMPPAERRPGWRRRMAPHHWMPVGADEFVTMDAKRGLHGRPCPGGVQLGRTEARGIQQAGLQCARGKRTRAAVVLAGPAGTVVKVNLVRARRTADKQTGGAAVVTIADRVQEVTRCRFVAQADTDDCADSIVATGAGTLHIALPR